MSNTFNAGGGGGNVVVCCWKGGRGKKHAGVALSIITEGLQQKESWGIIGHISPVRLL